MFEFFLPIVAALLKGLLLGAVLTILFPGSHLGILGFLLVLILLK